MLSRFAYFCSSRIPGVGFACLCSVVSILLVCFFCVHQVLNVEQVCVFLFINIRFAYYQR